MPRNGNRKKQKGRKPRTGRRVVTTSTADATAMMEELMCSGLMTRFIFESFNAAVPSSTSACCLHGFPVDVATSSAAGGEEEDYPYNKTAVFVLRQLIEKMEDETNPNKGIIDIATYVVREHLINGHPEHKINQNLIKSCIMLGTELLQQSTGRDWATAFVTGETGTDMKLAVAAHLAAVIIHMEFGIDSIDIHQLAVAHENLDSFGGIIRFFDSRTPCSCLNRLKGMHKRLGGCGNRNCKNYGPDEKLFTCSACQVSKYCCRECQKVDRPHHKEKCNVLAKKLAAKQSRSG